MRKKLVFGFSDLTLSNGELAPARGGRVDGAFGLLDASLSATPGPGLVTGFQNAPWLSDDSLGLPEASPPPMPEPEPELEPEVVDGDPLESDAIPEPEAAAPPLADAEVTEAPEVEVEVIEEPEPAPQTEPEPAFDAYVEPYVDPTLFDFGPPPPPPPLPTYEPPPIGFEPLAPTPPAYDGHAESIARDQALMNVIYGSPLVLDLGGDGIEVVSLEDSNATFDMDLDGRADPTGWIGTSDGFLVLDRNGNGVIDGRGELFGDMDGASNGFEHLAELDSNGDGVMNANDAAWDDLSVWVDANGDGKSHPGELVTMEEAHVSEIDLRADVVDEQVGDQFISHRSDFGRDDGSRGRIDDVWFTYAPSAR